MGTTPANDVSGIQHERGMVHTLYSRARVRVSGGRVCCLDGAVFGPWQRAGEEYGCIVYVSGETFRAVHPVY